MSDRLLIAIDVDGVLNVACTPSQARARGLLRDQVLTRTPWSGNARVKLRLHLDPAYGPMLLALADRLDAELAWATTWNHDANRHIAPRVGLPELPVIECPPPMDTPGHHWKRDAILAYAGDRPLAWLDDDFTPNDGPWVADRVAPTRIVFVDQATGLTQVDLDRIATWHDNHVKPRP